MIYNNLTELIGNTPLVKINNIDIPEKVNIYAKLEMFNPLGSVKDRIALSIIEYAEKNRILKKGMCVIEATSGNTGIALSYVCAIKKYKCIIVMPENMSNERKKILNFFGAELILTSANLGMQGAIDKMNSIVKTAPHKYFVANQFKNYSNTYIHKKTTAMEIWEATMGNVDIVIAGIGTGGTITGIGKVLKTLKKNILIIGVEPFNSPFITEKRKGVHKIQGIGAGFIPDILDLSIIDEIIKVKDEDALKMVKTLGIKEGIFAGISSGAAMSAGVKVAKRESSKGKNIVVILPDRGERYLSML